MYTKNDITTHDMSGDVIVFNTGDNVELEFDRSEIFWGYYVRATAFSDYLPKYSLSRDV